MQRYYFRFSHRGYDFYSADISVDAISFDEAINVLIGLFGKPLQAYFEFVRCVEL